MPIACGGGDGGGGCSAIEGSPNAGSRGAPVVDEVIGGYACK